MIVCGRIATRRFDKDGVTQYFTEIKADAIGLDVAKVGGRIARRSTDSWTTGGAAAESREEAATDQEAEERARAAWVAFTEHLSRLFRRFEMTPPNDPTLGGDFDRALAVQAVVAGSPATVREAVQELAANGGTDSLVGQFAWGDLAIDEVYRSFDLFAEHAMI